MLGLKLASSTSSDKIASDPTYKPEKVLLAMIERSPVAYLVAEASALKGEAPLQLALASNGMETSVIRRIIHLGGFEALSVVGPDGRTPFHTAFAQESSDSSVPDELLFELISLDSGKLALMEDGAGRIPLSIAIHFRSQEVLLALLEHTTADVDTAAAYIPNIVCSALSSTRLAGGGFEIFFDALIQCWGQYCEHVGGANEDEMPAGEGPIHAALANAAMPEAVVIQLLKVSGSASLLYQNKKGKTAMHVAFEHPRKPSLHVSNELLRLGGAAAATAVDNEGMNVLTTALKNSSNIDQSILLRLIEIERAARASTKNSAGGSADGSAAAGNDLGVVGYLVIALTNTSFGGSRALPPNRVLIELLKDVVDYDDGAGVVREWEKLGKGGAASVDKHVPLMHLLLAAPDAVILHALNAGGAEAVAATGSSGRNLLHYACSTEPGPCNITRKRMSYKVLFGVIEMGGEVAAQARDEAGVLPLTWLLLDSEKRPSSTTTNPTEQLAHAEKARLSLMHCTGAELATTPGKAGGVNPAALAFMGKTYNACEKKDECKTVSIMTKSILQAFIDCAAERSACTVLQCCLQSDVLERIRTECKGTGSPVLTRDNVWSSMHPCARGEDEIIFALLDAEGHSKITGPVAKGLRALFRLCVNGHKLDSLKQVCDLISKYPAREWCEGATSESSGSLLHTMFSYFNQAESDSIFVATIIQRLVEHAEPRILRMLSKRNNETVLLLALKCQNAIIPALEELNQQNVFGDIHTGESSMPPPMLRSFEVFINVLIERGGPAPVSHAFGYALQHADELPKGFAHMLLACGGDHLVPSVLRWPDEVAGLGSAAAGQRMLNPPPPPPPPPPLTSPPSLPPKSATAATSSNLFEFSPAPPSQQLFFQSPFGSAGPAPDAGGNLNQLTNAPSVKHQEYLPDAYTKSCCLFSPSGAVYSATARLALAKSALAMLGKVAALIKKPTSNANDVYRGSMSAVVARLIQIYIVNRGSVRNGRISEALTLIFGVMKCSASLTDDDILDNLALIASNLEPGASLGACVDKRASWVLPFAISLYPHVSGRAIEALLDLEITFEKPQTGKDGTRSSDGDGDGGNRDDDGGILDVLLDIECSGGGAAAYASNDVYSAQLFQLADMGFDEKAKNIDLLSKHKGDVPVVVEILTGVRKEDDPAPAPPAGSLFVTSPTKISKTKVGKYYCFARADGNFSAIFVRDNNGGGKFLYRDPELTGVTDKSRIKFQYKSHSDSAWADFTNHSQEPDGSWQSAQWSAAGSSDYVVTILLDDDVRYTWYRGATTPNHAPTPAPAPAAPALQKARQADHLKEGWFAAAVAVGIPTSLFAKLLATRGALTRNANGEGLLHSIGATTKRMPLEFYRHVVTSGGPEMFEQSADGSTPLHAVFKNAKTMYIADAVVLLLINSPEADDAFLKVDSQGKTALYIMFENITHVSTAALTAMIVRSGPAALRMTVKDTNRSPLRLALAQPHQIPEALLCDMIEMAGPEALAAKPGSLRSLPEDGAVNSGAFFTKFQKWYTQNIGAQHSSLSSDGRSVTGVSPGSENIITIKGDSMIPKDAASYYYEMKVESVYTSSSDVVIGFAQDTLGKQGSNSWGVPGFYGLMVSTSSPKLYTNGSSGRTLSGKGRVKVGQVVRCEFVRKAGAQPKMKFLVDNTLWSECDVHSSHTTGNFVPMIMIYKSDNKLKFAGAGRVSQNGTNGDSTNVEQAFAAYSLLHDLVLTDGTLGLPPLSSATGDAWPNTGNQLQPPLFGNGFGSAFGVAAAAAASDADSSNSDARIPRDLSTSVLLKILEVGKDLLLPANASAKVAATIVLALVTTNRIPEPVVRRAIDCVAVQRMGPVGLSFVLRDIAISGMTAAPAMLEYIAQRSAAVPVGSTDVLEEITSDLDVGEADVRRLLCTLLALHEKMPVSVLVEIIRQNKMCLRENVWAKTKVSSNNSSFGGVDLRHPIFIALESFPLTGEAGGRKGMPRRVVSSILEATGPVALIKLGVFKAGWTTGTQEVWEMIIKACAKHLVVDGPQTRRQLHPIVNAMVEACSQSLVMKALLDAAGPKVFSLPAFLSQEFGRGSAVPRAIMTQILKVTTASKIMCWDNWPLEKHPLLNLVRHPANYALEFVTGMIDATPVDVILELGLVGEAFSKLWTGMPSSEYFENGSTGSNIQENVFMHLIKVVMPHAKHIGPFLNSENSAPKEDGDATTALTQVPSVGLFKAMLDLTHASGFGTTTEDGLLLFTWLDNLPLDVWHIRDFSRRLVELVHKFEPALALAAKALQRESKSSGCSGGGGAGAGPGVGPGAGAIAGRLFGIPINLKPAAEAEPVLVTALEKSKGTVVPALLHACGKPLAVHALKWIGVNNALTNMRFAGSWHDSTALPAIIAEAEMHEEVQLAALTTHSAVAQSVLKVVLKMMPRATLRGVPIMHLALDARATRADSIRAKRLLAKERAKREQGAAALLSEGSGSAAAAGGGRAAGARVGAPATLAPRLPQMTKEFTWSQHFVQRSKFCKNGVLYWIGCSEDQRTPYTNPHLKPHGVVASMSSKFKNTAEYGGPAHFVGHDHDGQQKNVTASKPDQWMAVDLGPHRQLHPTSYMIRHGHNSNSYRLQSWLLEGSDDGVAWNSIEARVDEHGLDDPTYETTGFSTASLTISYGKHGGKRHFRHLRIKQSGTNSSREHGTGRNCLMCAGIEFYGELKYTPQHLLPATAVGGLDAPGLGSGFGGGLGAASGSVGFGGGASVAPAPASGFLASTMNALLDDPLKTIFELGGPTEAKAFVLALAPRTGGTALHAALRQQDPAVSAAFLVKMSTVAPEALEVIDAYGQRPCDVAFAVYGSRPKHLLPEAERQAQAGIPKPADAREGGSGIGGAGAGAGAGSASIGAPAGANVIGSSGPAPDLGGADKQNTPSVFSTAVPGEFGGVDAGGGGFGAAGAFSSVAAISGDFGGAAGQLDFTASPDYNYPDYNLPDYNVDAQFIPE